MVSRKLALGVVVAVAVLSAVGTWLVAQQIKNPADLAQASEPPPRSLVAVPVEARELSDDIVTRVNVSFDNTAGLKVKTDPNSFSPPVVTGRVPERGNDLNNGDLLLEISERPVFILEGEFPSTGTIRAGRGTEGRDILQLEVALSDLGFFNEIADQEFDDVTRDAIAALYEDKGYEPPELTETEKTEQKTAETSLELAEKAIVTAQETLDTAEDGETEAQRLQRLLARENSVKAWEDQQERARNWQEYDPEITAAQSAEKPAEDAHAAAVEALNEAAARVVPEGTNIPTIEEIEVLQKAADDAWNELLDVRENTAKVIRESDGATAAAEQLETDRRQWEITEAQYAETLKALTPDTTFQEEALEKAIEDRDAAQEALDEVNAKFGAYLPESEFIFVDNLPRKIARVLVNRTEFVNSGLDVVTVAGDTLLVEGNVSDSQRQEMEQGQSIIVDDPGLDLVLEGTITSLDDAPNENGRYEFEVALEGEFDEEQLVNIGSFRTVIPIGRTEGEVLAVPRNAIATDFDGTVRVQVERSPGNTELVEVTLGLQPDLGGYVEVIPVNDGELGFGDLVVIDEERAESESEDEDESEAEEEPATEDTPANEDDPAEADGEADEDTPADGEG